MRCWVRAARELNSRTAFSSVAGLGLVNEMLRAAMMRWDAGAGAGTETRPYSSDLLAPLD